MLYGCSLTTREMTQAFVAFKLMGEAVNAIYFAFMSQIEAEQSYCPMCVVV
jgi:hypothetical protein